MFWQSESETGNKNFWNTIERRRHGEYGWTSNGSQRILYQVVVCQQCVSTYDILSEYGSNATLPTATPPFDLFNEGHFSFANRRLISHANIMYAMVVRSVHFSWLCPRTNALMFRFYINTASSTLLSRLNTRLLESNIRRRLRNFYFRCSKRRLWQVDYVWILGK